jgi:hypothetical protein
MESAGTRRRRAHKFACQRRPPVLETAKLSGETAQDPFSPSIYVRSHSIQYSASSPREEQVKYAETFTRLACLNSVFFIKEWKGSETAEIYSLHSAKCSFGSPNFLPTACTGVNFFQLRANHCCRFAEPRIDCHKSLGLNI